MPARRVVGSAGGTPCACQMATGHPGAVSEHAHKRGSFYHMGPLSGTFGCRSPHDCALVPALVCSAGPPLVVPSPRPDRSRILAHPIHGSHLCPETGVPSRLNIRRACYPSPRFSTIYDALPRRNRYLIECSPWVYHKASVHALRSRANTVVMTSSCAVQMDRAQPGDSHFE